MAKKNSEKVVYPDIEVIVRRGAVEICTVAFFADEYGGVDVLVGVEENADRGFLATTFEYCSRAAQEAIRLGMAPDADKGGIPF